MNSAIKDRKLSKAEITEGLKLINAEVSTSSINKEPSAGVKVTLNNTTITISKADISVNSTIVKKDTNNVTAAIDVKKTTHYSAYIFYLPEWGGEMEDAREQMASFYGISEDDIGTASIKNPDELSSSWNMMGLAEGGKNISTVVINTHANSERLGFGDRDDSGEREPYERFTSSQISALNNKNIDNLILLGCNAGHLDYSNNNPAALFSQKINGGRVLASDDTVESSKKYFLIWGNYNYASIPDDPWYDDLTGPKQSAEINGMYTWDPIENKGWIIYTYSNQSIHTSVIGDTDLTINEMLRILK